MSARSAKQQRILVEFNAQTIMDIFINLSEILWVAEIIIN